MDPDPKFPYHFEVPDPKYFYWILIWLMIRTCNLKNENQKVPGSETLILSDSELFFVLNHCDLTLLSVCPQKPVFRIRIPFIWFLIQFFLFNPDPGGPEYGSYTDPDPG